MGSGHWSEEDWYLLAGLAVCFLLQCLLSKVTAESAETSEQVESAVETK